MSTTRTRTGQDGKSYPAAPLTPEQRARARVLAHRLVHGRHLSVRMARIVMAESYGIWRSVGSIVSDLQDYECAACAEPEHLNT